MTQSYKLEWKRQGKTTGGELLLHTSAVGAQTEAGNKAQKCRKVVKNTSLGCSAGKEPLIDATTTTGSKILLSKGGNTTKSTPGRLRRHSERSAIIIICVKTESNINKVSKDVTPLEPVVHTDKEEAQRR